MSDLDLSAQSNADGMNRKVEELNEDAEAREMELRLEFEQMLQASRDKLMLYLVALVSNVADAEDLCQRISLVMWQKFSDYDRSRSFLSWACGIARFEAYNFRRARVADRMLWRNDLPELLASTLENLDQAPSHQRLSALRNCVQALPEREQSFVWQIYWEGRSFDSIAQSLGCSVRTFYNRMYLLRRRLSHCVARRSKAE
ncbi:RNA polymerase sigma factor [Rosistilla ulvae]|uniref:RNA polymerase sigma factor n=1 Tax=Rosistilla ulvae TaxID=1930277 RepID=A0A517M849_9BACT|nr:sigma-70 family RNA polymerase sigma factor [Rosistilla ulvae]QDS91061.1 RNA polymerase sigma factor [Rosistilla ulvae]